METLLRYYPVAASAEWPARSRIDRYFDRVFDEAVGAAHRARPAQPAQPARGFTGANLYESPDAYLIELPLPGVQAADVEITVQDTLLTLKATRRWEAPPNAQPIWRGFGAAEMQQTVTLPGEVNTGAVQADLHDGILRLELPKAESARPRTIKVNGLVCGAPTAVSIPAPGVVETAAG